MRRRELLAAAGLAVPSRLLTRLDDALVLLPAPVCASSPSDIAARLSGARKRFDTSDLARLVAELPDLLAVAHEPSNRMATRRPTRGWPPATTWPPRR